MNLPWTARRPGRFRRTIRAIDAGIGVFILAWLSIWVARYYRFHGTLAQSRPAHLEPGTLEWKTIGIAFGDDETKVSDLASRLQRRYEVTPRMPSLYAHPGFMRHIRVFRESGQAAPGDRPRIWEELAVHFDEDGRAWMVGRRIWDFLGPMGMLHEVEYIDLATRTVRANAPAYTSEQQQE